VPCYNEARRLAVDAFIDFATASREVSFFFVDDGSTDETLQVLKALRRQNPVQFRVLELPNNAGKADAVRQGMLAAAAVGSKYIGYWDADLATPLNEILRFAEVLDRRRGVHVVVGVRLPLLGHAVRRRPLRRFLGWMFARCTAWGLRLATTDTQCGAKLFRWSPAMEQVFAAPFLSRWIFDVEVLVRLRSFVADPHHAMFERPVEAWHDVPGSKLRAADFVRAATELAVIFSNYRGQAARTDQIADEEEPRILTLPQKKSNSPSRRSAA
jgi:glycosyltransferase involved in cell wall biosynthesis